MCFSGSWGHHWSLSYIYGVYVYFPLIHFYELVVNFNHYELGLITSICACLCMTDFGTYNKSHGPARKNMDHPDFHHGWSVGRPRILVFVQHCVCIDNCANSICHWGKWRCHTHPWYITPRRLVLYCRLHQKHTFMCGWSFFFFFFILIIMEVVTRGRP